MLMDCYQNYLATEKGLTTLQDYKRPARPHRFSVRKQPVGSQAHRCLADRGLTLDLRVEEKTESPKKSPAIAGRDSTSLTKHTAQEFVDARSRV